MKIIELDPKKVSKDVAALKKAVITMAMIIPINSLSRLLGIASIKYMEKNALVNAPIHINPACPRLNSPKIPTVRLRDMANIT